MTESLKPGIEDARQSLATAAARNLATTTKTAPQMQEISSRWLLRALPWVQVSAGSYRVNRRLRYGVGDGRVSFATTGAEARVIPPTLCELPLLRGFEDQDLLAELAERFVQKAFGPGETIASKGQPADQVVLVAHGKVEKLGAGKYGGETVSGRWADGDHFGVQALVEDRDTWTFTARALTSCIVLALPRSVLEELIARSESLRAQVERFKASLRQPRNKYGEAAIAMVAGHTGEPTLPGTFVDYELKPREYELSVAQTVLRVHTRVADLYNQPMNQTEQQLRLTIAALRERQEHELINNREFGLLHNADLSQRIQTRSGPPTPDDLDELLSRRRKSKYFLAHPRTIAAFGRECNRLGLYPQTVELEGHKLWAWRGVPILPCDKIPITEAGSSSILVMRVGEENQGVIGLHQAGIPDEVEPGLNARFMGIDEQGIIAYLVSAYYSAAVLVPDALGILENVEIQR